MKKYIQDKSQQVFEFADRHRRAGFCGLISSETHSLRQCPIIKVWKWLFVVDNAVDKMRHFTLKRMMANITAVRKDTGNLHKIVLAGEKFWSKKFIVAECALGSIDSDV